VTPSVATEQKFAKFIYRTCIPRPNFTNMFSIGKTKREFWHEGADVLKEV